MAANFEIGLREALEVGTVVAVVCASVPRPWSRSSIAGFWGTLAVVAVLSAGASLAIYDSAAPLSTELVGIEVAIALLATVTLTSTAIWAARRMRTTGPEVRGISTSTATAIAALALMRETIEATWFLLAADTSSSPFPPVVSLLLGVLTGVAVAAIVFGVLFARARERVIYAVSQTLLVLVAAGMLMSATRSVLDAGWAEVGSRPLIELGFLKTSSGAVARFALGVIGIRPEISIAEGVSWAIYVSTVAIIAWRLWSIPLRLKVRALQR